LNGPTAKLSNPTAGVEKTDTQNETSSETDNSRTEAEANSTDSRILGIGDKIEEEEEEEEVAQQQYVGKDVGRRRYSEREHRRELQELEGRAREVTCQKGQLAVMQVSYKCSSLM
jgi:hypothetical protein